MRSRAGSKAFIRKHRVTVASWTALVVVSGALVAYAVNADGYPVHKAELNDGGIWVTNQAMGAVGRQNVPVAQIDGRVFDGAPFTSSPDLDVLQDGSAVISVNRAAQSLMPVDVSMAAGLQEQMVTASGADTLWGGGSLGVLDPSTGKLWATTVDPATGQMSLSSLASDAKPVSKVGSGAVGTAAVDGSLYAVSGDTGEVVTLRRAASGFAKPETSKLDADHEGDLFAMTAVGDVPVLLDDKGNLLTLDDGLGNVGADAQLQQVGPSGDEVLVATSDALIAVAVEGGKRREVAKVGAQTSTAAPVEMPNGCAFAAWGSGETGTLVSACGAAKAEVRTFAISDGAELVFRVNRNQIVLNDQKNGQTWAVTDSDVNLVSNWEAFKQETSKKDDKNSHKTEAQTTQPPQANPDELGARPGRTTVLNVLDNDLIASDGVLSIVDVKGISRDDVQIKVAPDRQTLLATAAPGASGTVNFQYTIDDGTAKKTSQDDGDVALTIRTDPGSGKPELRKNAEPRTYPVAAGGVVEFAVSPDWRDYQYGDPIVVSELDAKDLEVSTTALGLIRVEAKAGAKGGPQQVHYKVSTGGEAVGGTVTIDVIPAGTDTRAPKAEPDVVSGEVGGPILIKPLDNDIPGADGSDPGAHLELAGRVAPTGGLVVDTDLESGRVTVTGDRPGTYFLAYRAGFGAANRSDGQIRVDVSEPTPDGEKPVATPDISAVHGMSPVTVDVLANDFDPRGRMLVVQNAHPSSADSQLEVAVIDGRWVRVNAIDGDMTPKSQSVTYTISNGSATAEGSINVTQREALTGEANSPITQIDRITVRAGDTAAAPVLDNDATPSGDPVGLELDPFVQPIGELQVLGPAGTDLGTAYVSGRQVRYVAPEKVDGAADVEVRYVAVNTGDPTANSTVGKLKVHITPAPSKTNPDLAPTPRTLEGRVVQGDLVTIKLPAVGSDPDGDSVAISGIATAPKLGRILAFGANSLTYQAYPDAEGTDEFTYEVTDPYGERATGSVRVGVVQAGEPQAPLAVNDTWVADPKRTVDVDALGNDLRTPGTRVAIVSLGDSGKDVKLQNDQGPVSVHAPANLQTRNVTYTISNGLAESRGVITIKGVDDYNNPPITQDLYASPKPGAGSVEVDVLAAVFDVDGPESDLKLDKVTGVTGTGGKAVTIKGGTAVIPVRDVAQVLAYRVLDGDKAAAAAAIYVPARPTGAPYLKPGAKIELSPGSSKSYDLSDLVEDPEGDKVVLTTVDGLSASPVNRVSVQGTDKDTIRVDATKSEGPGSVVFEVSDRPTLTDPDAHTAYISVPVQVGDLKPVINCPTTAIEVPEGGVSRSIDVASICHVWTNDPRQARKLDFTADWKQAVNGVDVSVKDNAVQLLASGDAHRGDTGTISIGAKGYDATGTLQVLVVKLPDPKLAPIKLDTEATKSVSVDVADYLTSPMPAGNLKVKIMDVQALAGASAATEKSGSTLTFTPKPDTDGSMRYRLEVSDVGGSSSSGRPLASGDVLLSVVARPDAPTGLAAGQEMLSNTVALTWNVPDNNGKRIDGYEVAFSGPSSGTFRCPGSPCRVTGLKNGKPYSFTVRAHNATVQNDGWSEPSNSAEATPDALTGPPLNPQVVLQRDNKLTVSWAPPVPCDCSDVQNYRISWPGGVKEVLAGVRQTEVDAPNGDNITVVIKAMNLKAKQINDGPSTSVVGMGAGKPAAPGSPSLAPTNRPGNDQKAIGISWAPVGANGPAPTSYQVQRSGGAGATIVCGWQTSTSCADQVTNDGTTYTYRVQAKNAEADSGREAAAGGQALHISDWGATRSIEASAPPDAPVLTSATPTGANGTVTIVFNVGASHGASNTVSCNNGACGTWTFPTGGAANQSRTVSGFTNGNNSTITLRACNGGTANLCTSSNSRSFVTYGPIPKPSITAASKNPSVGDRTTSWSLSGNANGAPIRWTVTSSDTGRSWTGTSGNGAYSANGNETLSGYNQTSRYTVTITDNSGNGRASQTDSDTAQSGAPPNPTLTAVKGAECGPNSSPYQACSGALIACASVCYKVKSDANNFTSTENCHISQSGGAPFGNWSQGNGTYTTNYWVGGGGNRIYCDNGASDSFNW